MIELGLLSGHLKLVTSALLQLRNFKLSLIPSQNGFLKGLLRLRVLLAVMRIFEVEFLLKLVHLDLELDATLPLEIICFE